MSHGDDRPTIGSGCGGNYPSDAIMHCIDWAVSQPRAGITRIPARTGDGKTYAVTRWIAKALAAMRRGDMGRRQFIYITPRAADLKEVRRELEQAWAALANETDRHRATPPNFLLVTGNEKCFDALFADSDQYVLAHKGLMRLAAALDERGDGDAARNDAEDDLPTLLDKIRNHRQVISEDRQSQRLDADILQNYKDVEKRSRERFTRALDAKLYSLRIKEEWSEEELAGFLSGDEWRWLHILFPAQDMRSAEVVLLTASKCNYKFSAPGFDVFGIEDIPFRMSKSAEDEEALGPIVFMDEYDKIYESWLTDAAAAAARVPLADGLQILKNVTYRLVNEGAENLLSTYYLSPTDPRAMCDEIRTIREGITKRRDDLKRKVVRAYEKLHLGANLMYLDGGCGKSAKIFNSPLNIRGNSWCDILLSTEEDDYNRVATNSKSIPGARERYSSREWMGIVRSALLNTSYCAHDIATAMRTAQRIWREEVSSADGKRGTKASFRTNYTENQFERSVLSAIGIPDKSSQSAIMRLSFDRPSGERRVRFSDDPYFSRGYSITSIIENPSNLLTLSINTSTLTWTPESRLIKLVKDANATVIGLSATCTIPSPLTNYSQEYIRRWHSELDATLPAELFDELRRSAAAADRRYEDIDISICEVLTQGSRSNAEGVLDDIDTFRQEGPHGLPEGPARVLTVLGNQDLLDEKGDAYFFLKRLDRYMQAFDSFLTSDLECGLFLLNAMPRVWPGAYARITSQEGSSSTTYREELEAFLHMLCRKRGYDPARLRVHYALTSEIGKEWESIRREVVDGLRCVLITTYGTAGDSVNLLLPRIGDGSRYVHVGGRDVDTEADIPCLYLETPTNSGPLAPLRTGGAAEEFEISIHKALQNVSKLVATGAQSADWGRRATSAILSHTPAKAKDAAVLYAWANRDMEARLRVSKDIAQALGRLHRKNLRHARELIIIESDLSEKAYLPAYEADDFLPIPEEVALLDYTRGGAGKTGAAPYQQLQRSFREADVASFSLERDIKTSAAYKDWSEQMIDDYEKINVELLTSPTTMLAKAGPAARKYWAFLPENRPKTNRYYYRRYINASDKPSKTRSWQRPESGADLCEYALSDADMMAWREESNADWDNTKCISEEASGLTSALACPVVRKRFESMGYALHWEPGDMLLTPYLFTLYKGRVGEEGVKAIFDDVFSDRGYTLEKMPQALYEVADFEICLNGEGLGAYVDAKNRYTDVCDGRGYADTLARKLERLNGPLLIVNLLKNSTAAQSVTVERFVEGSKESIFYIPWLWDAPSDGSEGRYNRIELQSTVDAMLQARRESSATVS